MENDRVARTEIDFEQRIAILMDLSQSFRVSEQRRFFRALSTCHPSCCNGRMTMPTVNPPSNSGCRFPAAIISHCTWLYFRFALSYRDVEEMMAERGVTVSYESIREWCLKFGGTYTKRIRSCRGRLGDRWHLDEVFLTINGKLQYLWRAVDQDGEVLDILVQSRRNKQAAKKFFRKLLRGLQYVPRAIVTDKLCSYAAAKAEAMPSVDHHQQKRLNNRAENISPTHPRTRASHARVQISRTCTAVSLDLRSDSVVFPSGPTFTDSSELPRDHAPPIHTMA
jgi:putative transposase